MANYLQDVIRAIGAVTDAARDNAFGYQHPTTQQPAYNILPTSNAVDELTRKYVTGGGEVVGTTSPVQSN